MTLLLSGISVAPGTAVGEVLAIARRRLFGRGAAPQDLALSVFRRSVDARKRADVRVVYTVAVRAELSEHGVEYATIEIEG